MLRRDFIALLGGVSAMWPSAARGQQPARMKRIAMLLPYLETDPEAQARVAAFRESLNQLGWLEGKNVDFQSRWATDDPERLRADTAELISLQPDVIVTPSTLATSAVKRVTSTTPIVFINVIDPIGSGFAVSLARPGGNLTGFATIEASMGGKWLELLTAVAPRTKRAALLFGAANTAMTSGGSLSQIFDAATSAFPGISFVRAPVEDAADLENVIAAQGSISDTGLVVSPEPLTSINYLRIIALAAQHRLPAIYPYRFFVVAGGLISYGIDLFALYRQAGAYVDRILRGAMPADLPVQLPTKFELVINLKTAKALGVEIPPSLLARADEVIE